MPCPGNDNGPDTGAAADVHRAPDRREGLLQMAVDQLREAISVRPEEHGIRRIGGEPGMHEQQVIQA